MSVDTEIQWKQSDMIEVVLNEPDDFLKVRETLTRIGVASQKRKKTISVFCHILHKQGKYYIVHFKELFALTESTNITDNDIQREIESLSCCVIGDYLRLFYRESRDARSIESNQSHLFQRER